MARRRGQRRARPKPQRIRLDRSQLVEVVADGAIATSELAHGKLIPLLILDTQTRPDIEDLIRVQRYLPPGDVTPSWATSADGPRAVVLMLRFQRPVETSFSLFLESEKYGGIIDQIVSNGMLYIQAGVPGDRFSTTVEASRMALEVDSSGFKEVWDSLFFESVVETFERKGLDSKLARELAVEAIEGMRRINQIRMPE